MSPDPDVVCHACHTHVPKNKSIATSPREKAGLDEPHLSSLKILSLIAFMACGQKKAIRSTL